MNKSLWALLKDGQEAKIFPQPDWSTGIYPRRGNQQISARIVNQVGIRNINVVATLT